MAMMPKAFRAAHQSARADGPSVVQQRFEDRRRGTSASRGYGHKWRVYRLAFLTQHPLCRECEAGGRVTPATVVDHVVPHNGDQGLFWDTDNHQPLCKEHHDRKTVVEDGGFGAGVNWHPPFLMPSIGSLTVVCGAPLSGKSVFVAAHAGTEDVVLDVDAIGAEMFGTGLYDWPTQKLNEVGRERNRRLLALSRGAPQRAWLVVSEPKAEWRAWWHTTMQPDRIVVIETPRHVCMHRCASVDRGHRDMASAIDAWWSSYHRRVGDWIMRPSDPSPWLWDGGAGQIPTGT